MERIGRIRSSFDFPTLVPFFFSSSKSCRRPRKRIREKNKLERAKKRTDRENTYGRSIGEIDLVSRGRPSRARESEFSHGPLLPLLLPYILLFLYSAHLLNVPERMTTKSHVRLQTRTYTL